MSKNGNPSDINQTFVIGPLTTETPTFSACTYLYANNVISCSGDSYILLSSGETIFNANIVPLIDLTIDLGTPLKRFRDINTLSGTTSIWKVTQSLEAPSISACTEIYTNQLISCSGDSKILLSSSETLFNTNVMPFLTDAINLGGPIKRFRDINTVSGTSTVWISTISMTTPKLDLGLDSLSNSRIITADNSVIQDDILNNGNY